MTATSLTHPFTLIHNADAGGCGAYRILWPATSLFSHKQLRGLVSDRLLSEQEVQLMKPEIAILQRQYYDYQVKNMRMYRKHIPYLIYELDDLLTMVPKWSIHSHQMPPNIGAILKEVFSIVDRVTTTTEYLAEELQKINKKANIHVVPNLLPAVWKGFQPYKSENKIRVGWAGALAHKNDLRLLLPVMEHFGDRVDWVFMGLSPENAPKNCHVISHPGVVLEQYPMAVNQLNLDIGVVPLEDNTLNRCKSGIRVMELGINGCAIIASNLEPYKGFKNITRVKNTPEAWIEALEHYISNRDQAHEDGKKLRQEILENHMLDDHVDKYAVAWKQDSYKAIAPRSSDVTTIVIPVQKNPELTEKCLKSVTESLPLNSSKAELVIVDDAAELAVKKVVEQFQHYVKSNIVHQQIKGFSNSINDGIQQSNGDVLILNSDCVVHGNWLDKLKETLAQNPKTASVTPIGTDDSFVSVNLPDIDSEKLNTLAAKLPNPMSIEVNTPVGFCMLMRREALQECGLFDAAAYPRIYGEENDWGCTALLYGWKHLVCTKTVVGHLGNTTIDPEKNKQLRQTGLHRIVSRYPIYNKLMQTIEPLELRKIKAQLEINSQISDKPSIVVLGHRLGGGLETYIQRVGKGILNEGWETYAIRPVQQNNMMITFTKGGKDFKYPEPINLTTKEGLDDFIRTLKLFNCKLLVVNTLVQYPTWMDKFIELASKESGIPYDVVIHDQFYWCPQLTMAFKPTDMFCDARDTELCRKCLAHGSLFGFMDIDEWRTKYGKFLDQSRYIHTTSSIFIQFMSSFFQPLAENWGNKFKIQPHEEAAIEFTQTQGPNIAVLGHNLIPAKGSKFVGVLAQAMPNTHFYLFGNAPDIPALPNIHLAGNYSNIDDLKLKIKSTQCSIALLLSTVPEIHMYTLTDALLCGLSPVIFNLGVQAERVTNYRKYLGERFGVILPLATSLDFMINEIANLLNRISLTEPKTVTLPGVNYAYIQDYFQISNETGRN